MKTWQYIAIAVSVLAIIGALYFIWKAPNYYQSTDFDSKDASGTGKQMQASTLKKLNQATHQAGLGKWKISSAYRTPSYNAKVGGVSNSAHLRGHALDIHFDSLADRNKMLKALYAVGFRRFGVGSSFIHADDDPSLTTPAVWGYRNGKTSSVYAPLALADIQKL